MIRFINETVSVTDIHTRIVTETTSIGIKWNNCFFGFQKVMAYTITKNKPLQELQGSLV